MSNQTVHFKDIRNIIIENINNANAEILIAVAWFTDTLIINSLEDAVKRGVKISIIFFDDKINNKELFKNLYYSKSDIKVSKKLMHHKFCIIDGHTIINGSYNWTFNASSNDENIQVSRFNYDLVQSFKGEFIKLYQNCKSIDDFFEFSLDSLEIINNEFSIFLDKKRKEIFPYFYFLKEINISEQNKHIKNLKVGYYLIRNSDDEKSFLRIIYFLGSRYSLKKINRIQNEEILLPNHYDFIPSFSNCNDEIFAFKEKSYIVEAKDRYHNYVFRIDKENNIIGEKLRFTHKLPNGFYLQNLSISDLGYYIIDENLNKHKLDMISIQVFDEIGIFGCRKIKKFGDEYKYGLNDFLNKNIVNFKFDYYTVNQNNNEVKFIELPHFKKCVNQNKLIFLEKKSKNFELTPYKVTIYNYKTKILASKLELIIPENTIKENYIFLTDDNEKYFDFYIALSHNKYNLIYFNPKSLTISEFEDYKRQFSKGYIYSKNGYSIQSFMENIEKYYKYQYDIKKIKEDAKKNNNEGCFIATMAYGSYDHPNVILLRKFRDEKLLNYNFGRLLVKKYYIYSPKIVKKVEKNSLINCLVRLVLNLFIDKILRKSISK